MITTTPQPEATGRMFLVLVLDPAVRYEVLEYDAKKKRATLQGREAPFVMTNFTTERLQQQGYKLVPERDLPARPKAARTKACSGKRCKGNNCPPELWLQCRHRQSGTSVH